MHGTNYRVRGIVVQEVKYCRETTFALARQNNCSHVY